MTHLKTVLLATALALPAAHQAAAQDLVTVDMINPLPRSAIFYALIAGEAMGYFEEEGVAVNLLPSDTSIPYVTFVENGQAHLAMLDPNETIAAVRAGANINTIFEVNQSAPEGIAVAADSPIASVADLAGTTVGLVADRDRDFLAMALGTAGLTLDDVEAVVVGEAGPTLAAAFTGQTVSAITGASSDWLAIQAAGVEIKMITPEELMSSPANSFAINPDRIEELREPITGFLRAWAKGMYVAEVNPEALAAMTRAAVPEEWENEVFGQQYLDAAMGMTIPVTELAGDLQNDVWTALQERQIAIGLMEEAIPVDSFLNDTFIDGANDWSRDEVAAEVAAWAEANM